jgi:hypothetical protein
MKLPLARMSRSDRRLTVREAERVQLAMGGHSLTLLPGYSNGDSA